MYFIYYLFLIFPVILLSDEFSNHLSFQGFTGAINTPNAQVLRDGEAVIHYNNQFDNHLRDYNEDIKYSFENNYILGVGYLSSLELVGRLSDSKDFIRDVSANIKYKLPLYYRYFPNIAIGIQDIGGDRNYFNNKYVVMDKRFYDTRISLGYGKSGKLVTPAKMERLFKSSKRMNGYFANIEYKVNPYLYLLAEYDGKEKHTALKWNVPKEWIDSFDISAIVKQNLTYSKTAFAINLSIPLFKKPKHIQNVIDTIDNTNIYETIEDKNITNFNIDKSKDSNLVSNRVDSLKILQKRLTDFGFENLTIGIYNNDTIYIACENTIFDQNDLDAIGYILGTVADSKLKYKRYILTLLENRLETITIIGDIEIFKRYLYNPNSKNSIALKKDLKFTRDFDTSKIDFRAKNINSSFFKPRLEVFPGLIAGVGTDVGVLDYSLSLYTNFYTTLYDGLVASVQYETLLKRSNDFEDGKVFDRMYKRYMHSDFSTAMIHQSFHYDNIINTTSIGKFDRDYNGVLNLTNIVSDSGRNSFGLRVGKFKNRDKNLDDDKEVYLGTYRYFYTPLELFTEIIYGKFWYKDRGTMFKVKRFFDDTAISFYYQDTSIEKYIGFTITVPLTPRKLSKASKFGQVRGIRDFTTGLRSTVFTDNGANTLNPFGGVIPVSDFEIGSNYLNSYRLTSEYIKKNISRLRESYILYRE